jgi:tetratricopeptide (TPR) repeat protein
LAELEGQSDRAIREYRAAIDQGERRPEIVCHLAQLLYQRRRYLEAEKVIRTLPEQTPISSGLTKLAAEIALRRHEDQRALELALQALAVQTPDSRDRIWFSQILWANQRQEEAKAQLNQAIALARNQPDPYVAMIMFLARTGQREEAEIFLKKAQKEISPEQQPLALAQCFEALNQSERAEKQYQEAWKNRPRDGAALRALADFYLRQGQPYQAVPFLENLLAPTVLANSEDLAWARRSLAFALGTMSGTGDLDKVMKLLDDNRTGGTEAIEDQRTRALVLALQPSRRSEAIQLFEDLGRRILLNSDELFMLARLYEAEGNWRQARERLSSLVTAHPDRPLFMNYLVKALLVRRSPGNLAEAQALLHRLEGIAPEAVETLELKVRLLQKQDQVDSARAVIRTYAQKKNASLSLVAVLFELLGPAAAPEAEAAYRQLMETSKEDGDLIRFASFLSRQGRVEEALKWCSRLWENASPEIAAQTSLALLRGGKAGPGPTQQVAQRLQIALGKHRSTELMVVAAQLLDLQGRYEEAVAAYRAILQEDARHSTALNNLAWLLALKFQKPQEALATINRALDSAGPISTILDTRGVIYLHLNQPEPALKDFDQAVARTPRADFYFHRAQAFLALNRRPAAVDAFRVAQGLGLHPEMLHPLEQVAYQIVRVDLEQK